MSNTRTRVCMHPRVLYIAGCMGSVDLDGCPMSLTPLVLMRGCSSKPVIDIARFEASHSCPA